MNTNLLPDHFLNTMKRYKPLKFLTQISCMMKHDGVVRKMDQNAKFRIQTSLKRNMETQKLLSAIMFKNQTISTIYNKKCLKKGN